MSLPHQLKDHQHHVTTSDLSKKPVKRHMKCIQRNIRLGLPFWVHYVQHFTCSLLVISRALMTAMRFRRSFSVFRTLWGHENPLGLPKKTPPSSGLPIKQKIPGVKCVVLISSAKGGVGKLTVAANVTLALHTLGKRAGILDADIFGPSIPRMFQLSGEPRLLESGKLLPLGNYGVETMLMGYLVPPGSPVVWRGLMVMKAMQQLLFDVQWPELDYLIIDMPPGTGDTQLSISQQVQVDGAVIVLTPQDIALIDAVKGIQMFSKVDIPMLGLVQNMSYYICPECHHESHVFGSDGARREAQKHNLAVLGSIPLTEEICLQADRGKPIVLTNSKLGQTYVDIAKSIVARLEKSG